MRLWPRNMTGQVMLAVALALLVVQGVGAFLVYQAQHDRYEAAIVNAAAFRLAVEIRGGPSGLRTNAPRKMHPRARPRGFRIMHSPVSPINAGEARDAEAEAKLTRFFSEQNIPTQQIIVAQRRMRDDPIAQARAQRRATYLDRPPRLPEGNLLVAGVQLAGSDDWLVARIKAPPAMREVLRTLILQTAIIYLVLVAVVALVMRRITRPLAMLTERVEEFGQSRDAKSGLAPEGPDDIRQLIAAHNAMETSITNLLYEKDVMLGAIGHDLKTPLAALRVRIESVSDEGERTKMAATIEDITRSLDDMLSLARVGRPGDPAERVELSALVASVVEEYEDIGDPVEFEHSERIVLALRPTWLRRALRNLIDNAVRYGGRARVALHRDSTAVRIVIDDDGPGIADGEIAAMMEPFTRGEPSRNSATGGSGLGLALARAIADQHGGALILSNRPEGGLRAELTLPA